MQELQTSNIPEMRYDNGEFKIAVPDLVQGDVPFERNQEGIFEQGNTGSIGAKALGASLGDGT